jgi:hypothetical protein
MQIYQKELDCSNISLVPPFFHRSAATAEGVGAYTLYFGDLSDIMNEKIVLSLLSKIYRNIHVPLIIAAKSPSKKVITAISKHPHVHLVINPDEDSLQDMIAKAHITLLPSYYETGIQTGLLQALYNGRHCLTNSKAVNKTGLGTICHIADTAEAFQQRISQLYHQPFTLQESMDRKTILDNMYPDNDLQLFEWIWGKSYVRAES